MVTFVLTYIAIKKIIMVQKRKRIISTILIAIPALVLLTGGIMKLTHTEPETVVQFLTEAGFGSYMQVLGLGSILIGALLLYPETHKIGFLLASCYFAAALSLEISGAQPPVSALFITILWLGMFLKNKGMFFGV
ncbi:hypothetical protein CHU_2288 [Cytophaga hutchinsonii ATCC 33406]|uniref:Uncharacterized protein n=2 Tax=Cytophaga hutchinsonii TaxID=985 RepID=A0A6N4ST51_CYTH3|nr:hypothetical protein CHU_2288 [Cytophaga hutchinsonii ATCC 33406]SFX95291.1 hypothetical protein SAMN04487930_11464 [Cytophaga hutchinsonii ATCC 33406]